VLLNVIACQLNLHICVLVHTYIAALRNAQKVRLQNCTDGSESQEWMLCRDEAFQEGRMLPLSDSTLCIEYGSNLLYQPDDPVVMRRCNSDSGTNSWDFRSPNKLYGRWLCHPDRAFESCEYEGSRCGAISPTIHSTTRREKLCREMVNISPVSREATLGIDSADGFVGFEYIDRSSSSDYRRGTWFIEDVEDGIRIRQGDPCGLCWTIIASSTRFKLHMNKRCVKKGFSGYEWQVWLYNEGGSKELRPLFNRSLCLTLKDHQYRHLMSCTGSEAEQGWLFSNAEKNKRKAGYKYGKPNSDDYTYIVSKDREYCLKGGGWRKWRNELLPCDDNNALMIWVLDDNGLLRLKNNLNVCAYVGRAQPGEPVGLETCVEPGPYRYRKMQWQYDARGDDEISLVAKDYLCIANDWNDGSRPASVKLAECSGKKDQGYRLKRKFPR